MAALGTGLAAACGGAPARSTAGDACPAAAPSREAAADGHALRTVFVVVLENQDWASVRGSPSAPYLRLVAVSPLARPGFALGARTSHASIVRAVQEILGVRPLLRDAAGAPGLADLFTSYP